MLTNATEIVATEMELTAGEVEAILYRAELLACGEETGVQSELELEVIALYNDLTVTA